MLYPVMPIYLKSIGFSVIFIGILEGVAEATAGLSKGYFGKQSDLSGKRVPFVRIGYALSAISKPMMAVFIFPLWIFFARTIDRFGKGIRTGARDALLSEESSNNHAAEIFGFHRAMDTLGAVIGPSAALVYLCFFPEEYKILFLIAFLPGFFAVLSSFFLKDNSDKSIINERKSNTGKSVSYLSAILSFFSFLNYWKTSSRDYKRLAAGLLIFTLFNSSDVFLLLKVSQSGFSDTYVILIYIFYNLIYALAAYPVGILADKVGLKTVFISGLFVFAAVYFGMAFFSDIYSYFTVFLMYGFYAAATEGVSKAWITSVVNRNETATAIGNFTGLQSIFTMLASSMTGFIWFRFGAGTAFITTGSVTLLLTLYFFILTDIKKQAENSHHF
jgi:MFS family permease